MAGTFRAADGERRCSAHNRSGEQCRKWAIKGGSVCGTHGGSTPQVKDAAVRRVQEARALELAGRVAPGTDLTAYGDPLDALEHVLAMSHYMAVRLTSIVERLPDSDLAYRGRLGEQLRGEVTACQKALADLGRIAAESVKLGLDARRQRLTDNQVDLVVHALTVALEASGLGLEGQDAARKVLARELGRAAG
jgi:hypothetical protein